MARARDLLSYERTALLTAVVLVAVGFTRFTLDSFELPKFLILAVATAVILGLSAARTLTAGEFLRPGTLLGAIALALALAVVVSSLASDDALLSFVGRYRRYAGSLAYLMYLVLFLAAARAFSGARESRRLLVAVSSGAIFGAAYALLQAIGADPFTWANEAGDAMVMSTFGNSNFAAGFLGATSAAPLALAIASDDRRWLWGAAAALVAVGALVTGSIQGPLTVLVAWSVVGVGWVRNRSQRWFVIAAGSWAAAMLVAVGIIVLASVSDSGPLGRLAEVGSLEFRGYYWDAAADMFEDHPITGVGLDRYLAYFNEYRSLDAALALGVNVTADAAHSVPLGMLAQGGLALFLPYIAYLGFIVYSIYIGMRDTEGPDRTLFSGLAAVWLGDLAQSSVSIDVPPLAALNWIMGGAIVGLAGTARWRTVALFDRRKSRATAARARRAAPWVASVLVLLLVWPIMRTLYADMVAFDAARAASQGLGGDAYQEFGRAAEIAPWQPIYYWEQGNIAVRAEQYELAVDAYADLLEREGRAVQYFVFAARAAIRAEDRALAREWYDRALELDSGTPALLAEVADFLRAAGDPEEAVPLARRAVELEPGNAQAWFVLAASHEAAGETEQAAKAFRRVVDIGTDSELAARAREWLQEHE